MALNPQVLLLDEPFSALDPSTRQSLYRELRNIHAHFHCTIIFVTHDFSEARTLADRAAILLEGKLMAVTPAGALETGYFTPEVNAFLGRGGQEEQSPPNRPSDRSQLFFKKRIRRRFMTHTDPFDHFYGDLKSRFLNLLQSKGILKEDISIRTKALTAEEAIGHTKRKDFPIITGKVMCN